MAEIQPFRAIRYTQPDISDLIAPPYDILNEADKAALLRKDDHNIVAVDLPHLPPKSAGPDHAYARAAGDLTSWLDIRTLARDDAPAIYAYHQTYRLGGKTLTRKKFFARLRLEPFGTGKVFPHEQTFGGPKEDRLKLTIATRCNISPIFGLYPDSQNEIAALIEEGIDPRRPEQRGILDGVENKLWALTDLDLIGDIQSKMADKAIFIADGHHRYGTGLNFRQYMIEEMGPVDEEDPINFVLAVFCGMEDPGATIQPYFRSIAELPGIRSADVQAALSGMFVWKKVDKPASTEKLAKLLSSTNPQAFAFYFPKEDHCATLTPKSEDMLASFEPERNPAWRMLPYSILHRYVLDEVIGPKFCKGKAPTMHYHKTMEDAINDARDCSGIAVLMPATTMAQLRDICTAGELMPQKSTYFYPKLATGMVINPLY
ncbi:MAG TPA: DUF1015 domain-containing protein [Phycisphaerae bacterium]|nr:DUF1015 domain-containing protein [Phycisphaerae bacterium]